MTLVQLLSSFDMSEDDFVAALERDMQARPGASTVPLSAEQEAFLHQHAGFEAERASPVDELATAGGNVLQLRAESLPVEAVAHLLGVDATRVRHRARDRALYAFKLGSRLQFPTWQFDRRSSIPGLRVVIAAVPEGLHPLSLSAFMTTADVDLEIDSTPCSPHAWLVGGGDVTAVVDRLGALTSW